MTKETENELTNSSEWFDATLVAEKPTILSSLIFLMFAITTIFAVVAYGSVDSWAVGFLSIGVGLIAVLWLADSFLAKQFRLSFNVLQLPILGLIAIGLIQLLPLSGLTFPSDLLSIPASSALSIDPNSTRMAVVLLIIYLVFFAASLTFINSQSRLRKITFTIIVFGATMAFIGIIQYLTGTESIYGIRPNTGTSPFASYANKHHFAALMEMIIGLTLSLLYGESTKKDKRLLIIIALVLMGIVVVLTGSRGGLISLLGVVAFVTVTHRLQTRHREEDETASRKSYLLIGASLTFVVILFVSVVLLGGGTSLIRGTGLSQQDDISTGRLHFWGVALEVIKEDPVLGSGLDTFGTAFTKYDTWNGSMRVEQVHNDYLQIVADAGILGFICIAVFVFLLFRQGFENLNRTTDKFRRGVCIGALAGCFGILTHSFVDFPLRTPANPFIFLTLVVLATGTIGYPKLYRKRR